MTAALAVVGAIVSLTLFGVNLAKGKLGLALLGLTGFLWPFAAGGAIRQARPGS